MPSLADLRHAIRSGATADENALLADLIGRTALDGKARQSISDRAGELIHAIRAGRNKGLMETFLVEYGLSTEEGIALMRLAEALLRIPDAKTVDALIEDKIAPADWGAHFGKSASPLVNVSTVGLLMTGRVLDDETRGIAGVLQGMVKRLGEPVIRVAVTEVMREMGRQFVLGRTITEAMSRAAGNESRGYTHSYDMLGEAAMTDADAERHFQRYLTAITAIAGQCANRNVHANPGISIKLSALSPRYEYAQRQRVINELVPRVSTLALKARAANMGMTIDAEEADRLDLSLDIFEAVLVNPELAGWDGFGMVVQTYMLGAGAVIDWLGELARHHDRRIAVRLVKGAYWDSEIKTAQVLGSAGYKVFTHKPASDVSYTAHARTLIGMADRLYPQFATHNAQTMAAILEMAGDNRNFEFQRLHGMGAALHALVHAEYGTACRIYAPVGAHSDLLAYLVRRLLENGANSSFVNQIFDNKVQVERVVADPLATAETALAKGWPGKPIPVPPAVYCPARLNSKGWNLSDPTEFSAFEAARAPYRDTAFEATPILAGPCVPGQWQPVENPANPDDIPGRVAEAQTADVETALDAARIWVAPASARADILNRAADLYEQDAGALFALCAREAGKTPADAVAELREAVDFLRYYANQALALEQPARGTFACISPWNFPLAIFTGQVAAALAAGNAVIAKPAETTPLVAAYAVRLLHRAGVPETALQFLPGSGPEIGGRLAADPRIDGVCFTGSLPTAQAINRRMAANLAPNAALIAETGGINAMIVDSTALPEQAVRDIVASAFKSAGQRCSALRVLYVQEEIAERLTEMLVGAMDALVIGDPWELATDIGPLIDERAHRKISDYVDAAERDGRLLHRLVPPAPLEGHFPSPCVIRVGGIADVTEEIFGPVLHLATFRAADLPKIVADINASGYGLTFGLHTRIDERVEQLVGDLKVGNAYVNSNQIGAIVGSQPFGGEGLSGTGPKAGGPNYLRRFTRPDVLAPVEGGHTDARPLSDAELEKAIAGAPRPDARTACARIDMPGVTGESNRLSIHPRGLVLCLGPGKPNAEAQAQLARAEGCTTLTIVPGGDIDGLVAPDTLIALNASFDAVMFWGSEDEARRYRVALAARPGAIIPLITETNDPTRLHLERHCCIDTTAAGGNTSLLSGKDA